MKPRASNKIEVGDKIKILRMCNEPQYTGVEGTITKIGCDCDGQPYYRGTWGKTPVYPRYDSIKRL